MTRDSQASQESHDAERVRAALEDLANGKLREAERILLDVVANTPSEYWHSHEDENGQTIKFWDQNEFLHYVTWQQEHGLANKNIEWVSNAYPRAYYHLGFLCVKTQRFTEAIRYLERGEQLEPTNPKFTLEKAQALVRSGKFPESLSLYDRINQTSPFVSVRDVAVAQRGRGFALIEMGNLDEAEAAFRASLKTEPNNQIALHELQYIEHLRQGGSAAPAQSVPTAGNDPSKCAACGCSFDKGVMVAIDGVPVAICDRCKQKLTKKWWQFWK